MKKYHVVVITLYWTWHNHQYGINNTIGSWSRNIRYQNTLHDTFVYLTPCEKTYSIQWPLKISVWNFGKHVMVLRSACGYYFGVNTFKTQAATHLWNLGGRTYIITHVYYIVGSKPVRSFWCVILVEIHTPLAILKQGLCWFRNCLFRLNRTKIDRAIAIAAKLDEIKFFFYPWVLTSCQNLRLI